MIHLCYPSRTVELRLERHVFLAACDEMVKQRGAS